VARKIIGPNRDEVTGEWRKWQNEELHHLYSSPNVIRMIKSRTMRCAGHVTCMGKRRGAYRVSVGKPEGKRRLGRPARKWEDNIRMDVEEIGWQGVDWIDLPQDRDEWRAVVNKVTTFRILQTARNFLIRRGTISFSSRTLIHVVNKDN
jgi:hypothetical protein